MQMVWQIVKGHIVGLFFERSRVIRLLEVFFYSVLYGNPRNGSFSSYCDGIFSKVLIISCLRNTRLLYNLHTRRISEIVPLNCKYNSNASCPSVCQITSESVQPLSYER